MRNPRRHPGISTAALQRRLRQALLIFRAAGGRGVELAEEIDALRAELKRRRPSRSRRNPAAAYEITWVETGKTVRWTEQKARGYFGSSEWKEIKAGYLPHIVAVRIDGGSTRNARRNPSRRRYRCNYDIETAWTGRKADYVSPVGDYGAAGYSELAMHVGIAGKKIVQFALWSEKGRRPHVTWAHVKTADGKVTDGTAHEVLSPDILRSLPGRYDRPKLPTSRKNPLTVKESARLARRARYWARHAKSHRAWTGSKGYVIGRADGIVEAISDYGPRRSVRVAEKIRERTGKMIRNPRRSRRGSVYVKKSKTVWSVAGYSTNGVETGKALQLLNARGFRASVHYDPRTRVRTIRVPAASRKRARALLKRMFA